MKKNSLTIRSVTFAAVAGLSLGIAAPGAIAVAQDSAIEKTHETNVDTGNIDFSKMGSLTLFKRKGLESKEHASGEVMTNVPGTGLNGVKFRITKLNFDLKNGDWKTFPKTADTVTEKDKSGWTFETTTTGEVEVGGKVEAKGEAKFTDLPLGIYLVEEIEAPDGIVTGAPFIVSIPMVNPTSNAWNYEVIAYPKNTETKTKKTVKDAGKNIQDAYTYTITADAPTWGTGKSLKAFRFEDKLDERLEFQEVKEVKAGNTVLNAGDYTVKEPADNSNKLVVELTEQGLGKVESGAEMSLTFEVKRKTVGKTTELVNQADVIFNNPNTNSEVKNKTNEVKTYHGKLKVVKKDGKEGGKVLEGAEFQLYQCTSAAGLGENPLTVNGKNKWVTGKDGTITIDGLHVTDFADNEQVTDVKKFCLKETKAPAGYVLPPNPVTEIEFTRDKIAQTGELKGDDEVTLVSAIDNIKQDTPKLPMTGGAGVGILAAIGAAIVAAGAWFARRGAKN